MGMLSKWLKKCQFSKWFKKDNLLILVLAGILLVIIALPVDEKEENLTEETLIKKSAEQEPATSLEMNDPYAYASYLESELEAMLVQVKGVGNVSVMITLEGSQELIVHREETFICNDTVETDAQGGSRKVYQTDLQEKTVYEKNDQGEYPYITQTKLPKVSGVLIIAQGAGDGTVKKCITQIAEALLDVEAHKVTVAAMKE